MRKGVRSPLGVGVYLDYAASTPVDPRVARAMQPYFTKSFGNPSSLHAFGQEASAALDRSRESIAKAIGADFRELIFTGSATEANNCALRGVVSGARRKMTELQRPKVIVSAVEHQSVLEAAKELEREGVEVVVLPVSREGVVNVRKLEAALNERTVLVSVMYANNEVGTVEPVQKVSALLKKWRVSRAHPNALFPLLHTDAAQAYQFFDCNVEKLGVDLMTLSAHKLYGPKGIGVLYVRGSGDATSKGADSQKIIKPHVVGGGQEFGLRSGTENIPNIVGFAEAVRFVGDVRAKEGKRIGAIKKCFWQELKKMYPQAKINGPDAQRKSASLPSILNVFLPDRTAQDMLMQCDLEGLAIGAGAACGTRAIAPSHVLRAMGYGEERVKASIRISFGRPTTAQEVKKALFIIKKIIKKRAVRA